MAIMKQSVLLLLCLRAATAFQPTTRFPSPYRRQSSFTAATATATESPTENKILWSPTTKQKEETAMHKFKEKVGIKSGDGYEELWQWSVDHSDEFWTSLMEFLEIQVEGSMEPVKQGNTMPDVTYFPNIKLNFAQTMLRHGHEDSSLKDVEAIVSIAECRPDDDMRWTFAQARDEASKIANALRKWGVTKDDACGAYMPNMGETILAMLGVTSTGSMWTSCSPDFGPQAVADRFGQVNPKVLFVSDGYVSRKKAFSMVEKVQQLVESLPTLEKIVVLPLLGDYGDHNEPVIWTSEIVKKKMITYQDMLKQGSLDDGSAPKPDYEMVPFSHPQFVLYSSGTTGMPKSIAHGAGNVLLQHGKELILHSDLRPKDRLIYYTTCGWMMWNWMSSTLMAGATVVTFDGFAAYPKLASPWDVVERERITHMGTTPRYLQSCRARVRPGENNNLDALRVILSTGSPLLPEDFEYVYDKVKENVLLASISGGTDICSCFALGNPLLPVRQSELQAIGLGLDVAALDKETGKPVGVGKKGELACSSPFVAAPVCFMGDDDKKTKYREAYFPNEDGIWYHGDLVEVTGSAGKAGGIVIHGRSDTTLNPGGVRIGTAEVYRFAEVAEEVLDSLVIGEQIRTGKRSDVRIVLFVQLKEGVTLDEVLEKKIKTEIRLGASDAHVPALIRQVQKIPYTRSGKKVEVAVRELFAGVEPKNVGALLDPSSFDEYRAMAETGL